MLSVNKPDQQGFSLIEIAIVLTIIGVLSTGFLFGVSEFSSVQNMKEAQQKTKHLKEQILMFGKVNKFLPCPDSDFDGFENRNGSICLTAVGTAPYVDLGLKREEVQDAWGNFIRYAVNQNTSDSAFICDKRTSASFFCNSGFGVNWFTFTET
ncbi:MAG: type II secretion system GspH family protein, partial [Thiomicrorhabdus sp.]|nr:type II secretion system GspH family protein [Thiomicrorhabdus sp.]